MSGCARSALPPASVPDRVHQHPLLASPPPSAHSFPSRYIRPEQSVAAHAAFPVRQRRCHASVRAASGLSLRQDGKAERAHESVEFFPVQHVLKLHADSLR